MGSRRLDPYFGRGGAHDADAVCIGWPRIFSTLSDQTKTRAFAPSEKDA